MARCGREQIEQGQLDGACAKQAAQGRVGGMDEQYRKAITFGDLNTGNFMADYMNSFAWTIAGGSEEVQRNIIAERMLEMPREPKGWVL